MRTLTVAAAALSWMAATLCFVTPASANGEMCTEPQELDKYRLLRRISLDLRQQLPSYEEYGLLEGEEEVPEWLLDQWIGLDGGDAEYADAFRLSMRGFHSDLLFPNVIGIQLNGVSVFLRNFEVGEKNSQAGTADVWDVNSTSRRNKWRGSNQGPHCGNWPQSELGYELEGEQVPVTKVVEDAIGNDYDQEGWVEVSPYWAPDTTIKVCAFAAMNNAEGETGKSCESPYAILQRFCGCGSDLRWCYGERSKVEQRIWQSMSEQAGRLFDAVSVGGRPYTDLVLTSRVWTNGALDFWNKHLAPLMSVQRTADLAGPGDAPLPDVPSFVDDTWVERERGWPHGGVQTLAAYTLRFNTNRARANRFRIVFTNQYFIPPAASTTEVCDDEAPSEGCCTPDAEDLTERCVCQDCHQVVEPLAAYWAYHAESGSGLLTDAEGWFPEYNDLCDPTTGTPPANQQARGFCARFYVTEEGDEVIRPGWLRPLQYADATSDNPIHVNIAAHAQVGPGTGLNAGDGQQLEERGYAQSIVETGIWHQATVRNLWRHLMGRDMNLGLDVTEPYNELELLADLSADLEAHNSLPQLVKTLVTLDTYRRVR